MTITSPFSCNLAVQSSDTSKNNPTSFLWQFGDGSTSTNENASYACTKVGVYMVPFTATNSAGSDTTSRVVVVLPKWVWF